MRASRYPGEVFDRLLDSTCGVVFLAVASATVSLLASTNILTAWARPSRANRAKNLCSLLRSYLLRGVDLRVSFKGGAVLILPSVP